MPTSIPCEACGRETTRRVSIEPPDYLRVTIFECLQCGWGRAIVPKNELDDLERTREEYRNDPR